MLALGPLQCVGSEDGGIVDNGWEATVSFREHFRYRISGRVMDMTVWKPKKRKTASNVFPLT